MNFLFFPFDPIWSQTISAVSSVFIGGSAVAIAYRNYRTSSRKLELDLFKPRYEIYEFVFGYLKRRADSLTSPETADFNELSDKIDLAQWLFVDGNDEVMKFLTEIKELSIKQKNIEAESVAQKKKEVIGAKEGHVLADINFRFQETSVEFQKLNRIKRKKFENYMSMRR